MEAAARPLQRLHSHAQVQHVPVAAHDGHRAEGQASGDTDTHQRDARDRAVRYRGALDVQGESGRERPADDAHGERLQWLRQIMDWQSETKDAGEFMESLNLDLLRDEVYVFTPKGEVKSLPAGSTPIDFAYAVHTDVGHHCIGAKVDNRIVPLTYKLQSGDIVEILTSKASQGPSRDWLQSVQSSGARNKIRQWFKRERREDAEHIGREALLEVLRKQGLPAQRLMNSEVLGKVMKETNHAQEGGLLRGSGHRRPKSAARGDQGHPCP